MRKVDRQNLIRKLIKEKTITKQEEFVELLTEQGVEVTQATISRDIKEMQLIKVSKEDGSFYYSLTTRSSKRDLDKLKKMIKDSTVSIDQMDKFVVVKTIPGSAFAVGMLVERVYGKELFTVITSDDKVLLLFYSEEDSERVREEFDAWVRPE